MELKNSFAKYHLAPAWQRLFSKFLDMIVVVAFSLLFGFLIFLNSDNKIPGWKLVLLSLVIFLLFSIQFLFVPFISNGYTMFSWIFKIKIHSILMKSIYLNKKWYKNINFKFLLQLFRRELFLWIIPIFIFVVISFISLSQHDDASHYIRCLIHRDLENDPAIIIGVFFLIVESLFLTIPVIFIFNIIIMSKRRSFNDYFSDTVVIRMIDVNGEEVKTNDNFKKSKFSIKYKLPGEITPEAIEEIGE